MLECGSDTYHQPVLWIIHEYLIKLEDSGSVNLDILSEIVTRPVSYFIKVLSCCVHVWLIYNIVFMPE